MCRWVLAHTKVPMSVIVIADTISSSATADREIKKMAYKTIQTQRLTVADTKSIKRGFVKRFVDFVAKKGHVTVAELQMAFTGKQFDGKKITNERVVRYAYWCVASGVLKIAAQAKAAKAGAR
jgi:predicted alpha/beta hydrolase